MSADLFWMLLLLYPVAVAAGYHAALDELEERRDLVDEVQDD